MTPRDRLVGLAGALAGLALGLAVMDGLLLFAVTRNDVAAFVLMTAKIGITFTGLLVAASAIVRSRAIPPKPPILGRRPPGER